MVTGFALILFTIIIPPSKDELPFISGIIISFIAIGYLFAWMSTGELHNKHKSSVKSSQVGKEDD